jgi:hypothetical protein
MKKVYEDLDLKTANNFRIIVSGKLDKKTSDILGNLSISHKIENNRSLSFLEGKIIDQSELVGIINTLHNMRFDILSLKILKQKTA